MRRSVPSSRACALAVSALLATLVAPPAGAAPPEWECLAADTPAATLLFPYFEVDLSSPSGLTTLISIGNTEDHFPTLVRVTVWTEWAIATVSFDLYLEPADVQTINLRDLFTTGEAPVTGGPGLSAFPVCGESLGGPVQLPELLQRAHSGRDFEGFCFGAPRAGPSSSVRGYVTADVSRRCSVSAENPARSGYFDGPDPVAVPENRLWGDFFLVDPGQNLSQGQSAVAIWADRGRFAPGSSTFYGRYVGWSGIDHRMPLSSAWRVRYAVGSIFDDTDLVVWRDTESAESRPVSCGETPGWFPLTIPPIEYWNEEAAEGPELESDLLAFGFATQRVSVRDRLGPDYDFGWMSLDLDEHSLYDSGDERPNQGWAMWLLRAEGRFSVGQAGFRTDELCAPDPR